MNRERNIFEQLIELRDCILQERQYAISCEMVELQRTVSRKERLLQQLKSFSDMDERCTAVALEIRHENMRNAFLFRSALCWVRETIGFLGQYTTATTYSAKADEVKKSGNGRLLSGRI